MATRPQPTANRRRQSQPVEPRLTPTSEVSAPSGESVTGAASSPLALAVMRRTQPHVSPWVQRWSQSISQPGVFGGLVDRVQHAATDMLVTRQQRFLAHADRL